MKIRSGFVSNSSSSSFIVLGRKPDGVNSVLLTDLVLTNNVINYVNKERKAYREEGEDGSPVVWNGEDIYLTQFISDSGSSMDPFEELPHYLYGSGEHGQTPYGWGCGGRKLWKAYVSAEEHNTIFVRVADIPKTKKPVKKGPKNGKKRKS